MIRVVIVDDEDLARGLLREYLQSEDDVELWRSVPTGSPP